VSGIASAPETAAEVSTRVGRRRRRFSLPDNARVGKFLQVSDIFSTELAGLHSISSYATQIKDLASLAHRLH
jgi:hypothetical protein